jgi:phthalate 4,5-dioxygenase oxygenase subunit
MRLHTLRKISEAQTHIRVTNILFPQAFVIPMNAEMTITQFHVPVDDTGCYWYSIFTSFGAPVDKDTMRSQRLKTYPAPDYKPIYSRANGWGFNAEEQKFKTFTGMGFDINIHDQFACESPGVIADRSKENLGTTDKGIVLYRRLLMDAIKRSEAGQFVVGVNGSGPPAIDGIGPTARIDEYWKESDETRRRRSAWAA